MNHNPRTFSNTPNLATQKKAAAQSAAAKKCNVLYTCEEIKAMPLDSPIRHAHWLGGDPAVRAYLQQQAA